MLTLTAVQKQVLRLLAEGSTIAAAAKTVGIERVAVTIWCRTSADFHDALKVAQAENTLRSRDQLQALGEIAIENLRRMLTDRDVPERVRLTAALAVLDRLTKPAPALADFAVSRKDAQSIQDALDNDVQLLEVDPVDLRKPEAAPERKAVGQVPRTVDRPN